MICPKCKNSILPGDVACRNCRYPVAMMSGMNVSNPTPPPIEPPKEEVKKVEVKEVTPFIPPLPKKEERVVKEKNNLYSNYGEAKKAITSMKFILPIIIGIIFLFLIGFGIVLTIRSITKERASNPTIEEHYNIEYQDFIYELENDMTYYKDQISNTLYLQDKDSNISIQIIDATYSSTRSRKASLKSYFQSLGYQVSEIKEENVQNTMYLTMEAKKKNKTYLFAITSTENTSKCFGVSILMKENLMAVEQLEKINPILKGAKYQKKTSPIKEKVDFQFKDALK